MGFLKEKELKELKKKLEEIIAGKEEIELEKTREKLGVDYPKLTQFAM